MSDDRSARFQPSPRREPTRHEVRDTAWLREELSRLAQRSTFVAANGREGFTDGAVHHDVASMILIRLAALLERPEFGVVAEVLTPEELAAVRTTRNIAAHAGYVGMNDDLFWNAVTVRVPEIIERLLEGTTS